MKIIKKKIIINLIIILSLFGFNTLSNSMENKNFYQFNIIDIDGEKIDLHKFEGKTILLVNVASKCGFTKQYTDLQKLWDNYKEKNFIVLAVPSNQFGGQEPGNNNDIKKFCETNFNINFPITSKYDVKGENAHEIYKWAKETYGKKAVPKWNFHKILINKKGEIHDTFASFTNPMSNTIISEIEKIL